MPTLREVFNRDVMLSYRDPNPVEKTPLFQTGAFTSDSRLSGLLSSGISEFSVPHINPIDTKLEPNYSNTIYTDIASPQQITAGKTKGRTAYLNTGFLESTLERHLLGESPLALMQGMINNYWAQQAEHRALATVFGIKNHVMQDTDLKDEFVLDVSKTSSPTNASAWSVDAFIDAESLMNRMYRGRGAILVHPKIAAKMRKQQLLEQVTTSDNLPPITTYNGRLVVEDEDGLFTVVGTGASAQYITYLMGAGAFAASSIAGQEDLELERTAATGNGSGHTALWTRRDMLIHPQGFSFVADDSELTGGTPNEAISASWTDLQNPDFWELGKSAKDTSIRFLITNL